LEIGCQNVDAYIERLASDPAEYSHLVNTILINVTKLFRDPEAWEFLQTHCLPALLASRSGGERIRAWSAGCATGQEPYSLAICLAELLDEHRLKDVRIYGTDMDEGALAIARCGIYEPTELSALTRARRERFFEALPGGSYKVRRELRNIVIFGRHDLLRDPPISRLDLLLCRNVLIYFDITTQQQILSRFRYALRPDGYLFLGRSEMPTDRAARFRAHESMYRIFQLGQQGHIGQLGQPGLSHEPDPADPDPEVAVMNNGNYAGEPSAAGPTNLLLSVISRSNVPLLLLDVGGRISGASESMCQLLQISSLLIGRNLLELEERFRPSPLRMAIDEVRTTLRSVHIDEIEIRRSNDRIAMLSVDVQPILDVRGTLVRILVWAQDRTRERELSAELTQLRLELKAANEELQCSNEELETANEELQSTNEELETTNEELQSTNEELETTIEELQSTNEELETANDELRARQDELHALTRYQEMVLSGLHVGLIALNTRFVITSWNRMSEDTWGLRESEAVGKDFFTLDIGLPARALRDPLEALMQTNSGHDCREVDATNRRGRAIRCRVRMSPMNSLQGEVMGTLLSIEENPAEAASLSLSAPQKAAS
jgi:two-component system CheB/CheR fusion protein